MEAMTFGPGDEIRKRRILAKMGQAELALKMGVSRPLISKWERGISEPTISQWRRLADIFSDSDLPKQTSRWNPANPDEPRRAA